MIKKTYNSLELKNAIDSLILNNGSNNNQSFNFNINLLLKYISEYISENEIKLYSFCFIDDNIWNIKILYNNEVYFFGEEYDSEKSIKDKDNSYSYFFKKINEENNNVYLNLNDIIDYFHKKIMNEFKSVVEKYKLLLLNENYSNEDIISAIVNSEDENNNKKYVKSNI